MDPCTGYPYISRDTVVSFYYTDESEKDGRDGSQDLIDVFVEWSRLGDLNPRPADYKSAAIPLSQGGTETADVGIV